MGWGALTSWKTIHVSTYYSELNNFTGKTLFDESALFESRDIFFQSIDYIVVM